jgi:predicted permease
VGGPSWKLFRRLKYLLFRSRYDVELRGGIETRRALQQAQLERDEAMAPDAGRIDRRLRGEVALAREDAWDVWVGPFDTWWQDLRYGTRALFRSPGFTATAVLTLALCLGVNAALLSVVHNVVLRPLRLPESDRIVLMTNSYPKVGVEADGASVPDYEDRLRATTVFEAQALFRSGNQTIEQYGIPTRIHIMQVTPSFFRLLRVPAQVGRTFTDEEGKPGHEHEVVLSDASWRTLTTADRVIGHNLRIDGQLFTIVGVMPRDFTFLTSDVVLWTPLTFTAQQMSDQARHVNQWQHIGRLRRDATLQQAQAQIDALNATNLARFPEYKSLLINAGFRTVVSALRDDLVKDVKAPLYLMWCGALFVLFMGCVNVANLVLVRSRTRAREIATRMALGAGAWRVGRQLLTEYLVLTMASVAAGLLCGAGSLRALATLRLLDLPRGTEIGLDGVVVGCALGVALAIGATLGLISMANALPARLTVALRAEGRTTTSARGMRTLRRALVVTQVAVAFVLLVGAGLLLASFRRVLAVDPGFAPTGVFTGSVMLPSARYPDDNALRAFTNETLHQIRALPGIVAAGATNAIPYGGNYNDRVILAEGNRVTSVESVIAPSQVVATPGYFEAIQIHLRRGRFFGDRDTATSPHVAIVDDKLGQEFWPGQDPIGRRLYFPGDKKHFFAVTNTTDWFTIVGVVGEVKLKGVVESQKSHGTYYFPYAQQPGASRLLTLTVRTTDDLAALSAAVRRVVTGLDREVPLFDAQTLADRSEKSLGRQRALMLLSLSFGAVALGLTAIGIYGVLSHLVSQRRREIGIRVALGGTPAGIVRLVLREGGISIGAGFLIGGAGTAVLQKGLDSELFGIRAADPEVLAITACILLLVAVVACIVPASRAARIDPVVALAE